MHAYCYVVPSNTYVVHNVNFDTNHTPYHMLLERLPGVCVCVCVCVCVVLLDTESGMPKMVMKLLKGIPPSSASERTSQSTVSDE